MIDNAPPRPDLLDPLSRRITSCAIWLVGYALVWWFNLFHPLPHVAWVNFAVIAAILASTLPPARIRPFSAAVSLLALAAIIWLVINNQLFAIVLAITGLLALSDGIFDLRGQRRSA
jgi:hypothetical protein